MCAKALDLGTCFLVGAEYRDGKEVFTSERDAFFSMPNEDFAEDMLTKAGAFTLVRGDRIYVVGEDALRFSVMTGNEKDYRRPMARGVLNPGEEEAIAMIEVLIEAVVGKPSRPGEALAVTIPAPPVDASLDPTYHRMVVERLLRRLGYEVRTLNEALGVIFAENPTALVEGREIPFSGVAISFGGGMMNVAASWKARRLFEFSLARGGDWIDQQVAQVRNLPVSKVTNFKERKLNLERIDARDALSTALEIYHEELIRYLLDRLGEQVRKSGAAFEEPIELVLAGGTACPAGFVPLFERLVAAAPLPFPVRRIRLARDPLKAPAAGALIAALAQERKTGSKFQVPSST